VLRCEIESSTRDDGEILIVRVFAEAAEQGRIECFALNGWQTIPGAKKLKTEQDQIIRTDRAALARVPEMLAALKLTWWPDADARWQRATGKKFPSDSLNG